MKNSMPLFFLLNLDFNVFLFFFLQDDDDSDLESELEAFPSVTSEASTEAAACVKVGFYPTIMIVIVFIYYV